jgi:Uma2 family endonuclease
MQREKLMTGEEFEAFALLPENADLLLEFIEGEVHIVVSNNRSSQIAATILAEVRMHVRRNQLGFVTGADGGYRVGRQRFIPDVAFVSKARQAVPSAEAYNPIPPDLAVEVQSPTDSKRKLRRKARRYLEAGTRLVWLVFPRSQTVEVHSPGQPARTLASTEVLDGGAVLPGFALPVQEIFAL